jgi:hypothetical protein
MHDIYGGVNIGYMPGDVFVSDVVGDDVQYEANRIVAADTVATLGRKSVSSSMNDVGGSVPAMTQGFIAPKGGKYGIGSLRMEVFVTDRESASGSTVAGSLSRTETLAILGRGENPATSVIRMVA